MVSDLRFALRLLARQPGFAAVAILTIAVAVGLNTALFSVVNAVVLKPIDYVRPDELVRVWAVDPARDIEFPAVSWPRYEYFRDHATMLASTAVSVGNAATVSDRGDAEQVGALMTSANFFSTLGLAPQLGRFFSPTEDKDGGPNVVLVSAKIWHDRFGGAADVLGQSITIDGVPHQIIGVLPARMPVPFDQVELVLPRPDEVPFLPPDARSGGAAVWQITARLKPGVSRAAAERQLGQLNEQLRAANRQLIDGNNPLQLRRFADEIIPARLRLASWVLFAAVGAVLLIACANVANLLLSRLASRAREVAVRASLGAGRRAIVQQFLVESLVIAALGGALGVFMAVWSLDGIRALAGNRLPRIDQVAIDAPTLLFALGATALTAILVGIYPALQATRADVQTVLKNSGRGMAGAAGSRRFRGALVIVEVAVSVILMIGAALLLYSFVRLEHTRLGFDPTRVAVGTVNLPARDYPTPEKQREFVRLVQQKLDDAPELAAGGVGFGVPLTNSIALTPYSVSGRPILPVAERKLVSLRQVTGGFFRSLGYTLVAGRFITDADRANTPMVGVINESFARKLFRGGGAVGQTLLFGRDGDKPCQIVGVVRDVRSAGIAAPVPDEIYFAYAQRGIGGFQVIGRAKPGLAAAAVLPVLRRAIHQVDPRVALAQPQTGAELVAQSLEATRALSLLLGLFAAIAALLAVVGIYSVIAYNVSQRTAEIGVRLALGASAGSIFELVLKAAAVLVGSGLTVGVLVAVAVSRILRQLLFQVQPFDPAVFAVVALVFATVGLVAALIPARRATLVDPLTALRAE